MVTRSVVQSAVHTTATALVHLPPDEWAGWITYLCEVLEEAARTQGHDYDADMVLQEVIKLIQARITRGNW